jgi:two-component system KDP operon response regulator KdpE
MSEGSIVVVSREPGISRALCLTLAAKGYEVTNVESVDDVFRQSHARRYDLVLLDNDTSTAPPAETCREIRACSDMGIVIISGDHSEEKKLKAILAGADAYIAKPFGVEEVFAGIRAAIGKARITTGKPRALVN